MTNAARRAYSAGELLALRQSASEEAASAIENGNIKDHVLRGTRSDIGRATSALYPLQSRQPAVLTEIHHNVRPGSSPTSSLKKQRAEQILKQHGSPPGLRVTAGGRIVTSDQSPLCSPRYGYSAINKNGGLIRFAPGYPPPPHTFNNFAKSLPNGFVAQDPDGKLCQMVDGRFIPINEMNGVPQLYVSAPNLTSIPPDKVKSDRSTQSSNTMAVPSIQVQVNALEKQYQKLETERRGLDKAEVLQRGAMTNKGYNQLIQKRRELVSHQDEIRRDIKALRKAERSSEESRQSYMPSYPGWSLDGSMPSMYWPPEQYPQGYDYFAPFHMQSMPMPGPMQAPVQGGMPWSDAGVPVNSIQEVKPREARRSVLNPKSAVYEPSNNTPDKSGLAEAVKAHNAWAGPDAPRSHSSSEASFTTADFFPKLKNQRSRGKPSELAHQDLKEERKVSMPDRSQNVSPKTRRATDESTSEYDEGFKTGMSFAPVDPTKSKEFLDGYCAGLKHAAQSPEKPVSPGGSIAHRMERRKPCGIELDAALKTAPKQENLPVDLRDVDRGLNKWVADRERSDGKSFEPAWEGNRIEAFDRGKGQRVLSSPIMDWRGHSIAEGLTTGVLGQIDGTETDMVSLTPLGLAPPAIRSAGASPTYGPRTPQFKTDPGSPTNSPLSLSGKKVSPAKAKLAQMANRASKVFGSKDESPREGKWRNMLKKKQPEAA